MVLQHSNYTHSITSDIHSQAYHLFLSAQQSWTKKMHFFSLPVPHPRHTVQNRTFPEFRWCFFDDVPDGISWNIHKYWGVWRILPRKTGIYRACPFGGFWHKKSPQTPNCRRLQAPLMMAGAEGLEPSARGFGELIPLCCHWLLPIILSLVHKDDFWFLVDMTGIWCFGEITVRRVLDNSVRRG